MNCIDGIEGVAKKIIDTLYRTARDQGCDDSECIRCLRAAVEGAGSFVMNNREVVSDPSLLTKELYLYAKTLWLSSRNPATEEAKDPDEEYYGYYFDRIYHQQNYPL
ncbi:hypothetical protein OOT00_11755 [Desulfobotulus sp. H1]|uniref:Uncharacterized protein n=1 Tax=Desulfobotulus pelophilus TaxID=2823377 RepID=A0ABT3NB20_9BACT|nr:hypothetical protein [Desulfobotulus pelophilus]MCW7754658.1 hypothetical protein [Desulfobotulus pelophilus]